MLFDAYVMVDWSAAAVPATGADSIWIASAERRDGALPPPSLDNPPTRRAASALLADRLSDLVARDRVTLVGFDFAFGYPAGLARRLRGEGADWRGVWKEIAARVRDSDNNANNRFEVAAALNERISGGAFPFWGCPARAAGPLLSPRKPAGFGETLPELRLCDRAAGGAHPVWKLAYPGCVGSQTLLGIAHLQALRNHPWLAAVARVWPFETGLRPLERPANGGWRVLFAEIYPSIFDSRAIAHEVKDARQVRAAVEHVGRLDAAGGLAALFAGPADADGGTAPGGRDRGGVDPRRRNSRRGRVSPTLSSAAATTTSAIRTRSTGGRSPRSAPRPTSPGCRPTWSRWRCG